MKWHANLISLAALVSAVTGQPPLPSSARPLPTSSRANQTQTIALIRPAHGEPRTPQEMAAQRELRDSFYLCAPQIKAYNALRKQAVSLSHLGTFRLGLVSLVFALT